MNIKKYDFYKTKYGNELLIDLIDLSTLEKYIRENCPHTLSYYDITLLTGGKGHFHIDQNEYEITPGAILFSSPGQIRYWDVKEIPQGYVLIFEEEFLNHFLNDRHFINDLKYFNSCINPPQLALTNSDRLYVTGLMKNIKEEIDHFSSNGQYMLQALLYQTLIWLNRKYSSVYPNVTTENYNRYIRQFTNIVDKEFKSYHSVSYYAEKLNITSGHLNDLCKAYLGKNAKQHIQQRVILEAKRLLLYTDLSVFETALQLNFENSAYFIRMFKQTTGMTPLAFRQTKNP